MATCGGAKWRSRSNRGLERRRHRPSRSLSGMRRHDGRTERSRPNVRSGQRARAEYRACQPTSAGSGTAAVTSATTEQTETGLGTLEALYEEYHRQALGLALRV